MILCYASPVELSHWIIDGTRWKTALDLYRRRKEITHFHLQQEDLMRMMRGYPEVNLRLAIEPMEALIEKGMVPIYATKEDMQAEFEMGLRTGAKAV